MKDGSKEKHILKHVTWHCIQVSGESVPAGSFFLVHFSVYRLYCSVNFLVLFTKHILHLLIGRHICLQVSLRVMFLFLP